ncbi:Condensin complex subunit 3-like protein [Drosera capensis]
MASSNHEDNPLLAKIVKVFNESSASYATHKRKLKELSHLRSSWPHEAFFASFTKSLTPLLNFQRRTASTERAVRFVAIFCSVRDSDCDNSYDVFLEEVLKFLVTAASAANKTVRFRACQLISEIIMRFPDDAEVSDELWDEVIGSMKLHMGDKFPIICYILCQSSFSDVRKTIILSLPASNLTSQAIVDCILDVNESVRRAAYIVLANKFPIQSLR